MEGNRTTGRGVPCFGYPLSSTYPGSNVGFPMQIQARVVLGLTIVRIEVVRRQSWYTSRPTPIFRSSSIRSAVRTSSSRRRRRRAQESSSTRCHNHKTQEINRKDTRNQTRVGEEEAGDSATASWCRVKPESGSGCAPGDGTAGVGVSVIPVVARGRIR